MTPMLSIIMPAVRVQNWKAVYDSILKAWPKTFELIIISHRELPEDLKMYDDDKNTVSRIKWIYDEGCPTRKTQIGLQHAIGQYVTWFVDDGVYLPDCLRNLYTTIGFDDPCVLKYGESLDGKSHIKDMESDEYYLFRYHPVLHLAGVPSLICKVLSFAIMPTQMLKDLGGFDCAFEHIAMAETDLSVRMEKAGIRINISPMIILELTWEPGDTGAHAGVNHAQMDHDLPLFLEMYKDHSHKDRIKIDIDNWKNSPAIWTRRTA